MHCGTILLALGLTLMGLPAAWAQKDTPEAVMVPDASLRAVLEDSLDLSAGDPITAAALSKLTVLEATDMGIVDLTGLASATGLTRLNLGPIDTGDPLANRNAVSDLSPLSGLTGLTWLHLAGNSVADVTPLSGLTGLTFLNLQVNEIADVDSLSGLTGLTDLYLAFNFLQDASALSGLTGVTVHDLPRPPRHPKLGSSLSHRVEEDEGSSSEGRSVRGQGDQGLAAVVPVRIRTDTRESVDTVARFLEGQGISSDTWRSDGGSGVQGLLWAHVPLRLLVRLSEQPGVISVREVLEAIPQQSGTASSTASTITAAPAHGATRVARGRDPGHRHHMTMREKLTLAVLLVGLGPAQAHVLPGTVRGIWQWPADMLPTLDRDLSEWEVVPDSLWLHLGNPRRRRQSPDLGGGGGGYRLARHRGRPVGPHGALHRGLERRDRPPLLRPASPR